MAFVIDHLDHLVLTVANVDASVAFHTSALGTELVTFGGRMALRFGEQKTNLHQAGKEFEPKAAHPTPGSGNLCFITSTRIEDVISHLAAISCTIEEGPVERTGYHHDRRAESVTWQQATHPGSREPAKNEWAKHASGKRAEGVESRHGRGPRENTVVFGRRSRMRQKPNSSSQFMTFL